MIINTPWIVSRACFVSDDAVCSKIQQILIGAICAGCVKDRSGYPTAVHGHSGMEWRGVAADSLTRRGTHGL